MSTEQVANSRQIDLNQIREQMQGQLATRQENLVDQAKIRGWLKEQLSASPLPSYLEGQFIPSLISLPESAIITLSLGSKMPGRSLVEYDGAILVYESAEALAEGQPTARQLSCYSNKWSRISGKGNEPASTRQMGWLKCGVPVGILVTNPKSENARLEQIILGRQWPYVATHPLLEFRLVIDRKEEISWQVWHPDYPSPIDHYRSPTEEEATWLNLEKVAGDLIRISATSAFTAASEFKLEIPLGCLLSLSE